MAETGFMTVTLFDSCPGCKRPVTADLSYSIALGHKLNLSENQEMGIPAMVNVTGVRISHDCASRPRTTGGPVHERTLSA